MKINAFYIGMPKMWLSTKFLRVMKVTAALLFLFLSQVYATSFAQKMTLHGTNISLKTLFEEIKHQTQYDVICKSSELKNIKLLELNFINTDVSVVLEQVLPTQGLSYILNGKTFVIRKKNKNSFLSEVFNSFNRIDIKGQIVDSLGKGFVGAHITVKGEKRSTLSGLNGEFNIQGIEIGTVLTISYIGFVTKDVAVNNEFLRIILQQSTSKLDEVQIIGYGTTTQRLSTGSVSKIGALEMSRSPSANPILSLQARATGVLVTENSGLAGSSFNIVIRGQNTIGAGKIPLYIIDGVPFGGKAIEQTGNAFASPSSVIGFDGFNPLNSLSPNAIESIEVLKDADATAIYGSRAANGVVLITTKKGKSGATKVDFDVYGGMNSISKTLPMLNASQYLNVREQAFDNDKINPTTANAPDLTLFREGGDKNFQDFFFNTGKLTNATLDISGGNQHTQFAISGNYRLEKPVFSGDFSDKHARVRINLQHSSEDNRFKLSSSISVTDENNKVPSFDLWSMYNLPPNLPLLNADGTLAWVSGYENPLSSLINDIILSKNDLLGSFSGNYQITKGLSFKTDIGYHKTNVYNSTTIFRASKNPSSASSGSGLTFRNYTDNSLYTIEPQFNYKVTIGKGQLNALIGATYQNSIVDQPTFYLGSFTSDELANDFGSMTIFGQTSSFSQRKYASIFGRANYILNDKYIINANFRRDGSSAFGPGNQYGNFGSFGAAWIFTKENYITDLVPWLSFGKLKASYGSIGNDQIGNYGFLSYYSAYFNNYSNYPTLNPAQVANKDNYSWETTKKFDIATDLGFIHDRILLSASYYRNITNNMLLPIPLPSQVGFVNFIGNIAGSKVLNKGFELEINTTNILNKNFTWKTSFNCTSAKNKLVSYPGLESSVYAAGYLSRLGPSPGYVVGQPLNMLFGYEFTGFNNGVATVRDVNGDGAITPGLNPNGKGDWVPLGSADPKFYGGLNNSISYKGLQLDVLFQFVSKKAYNIYHGSVSYPGSNQNLPTDILNLPITYSTLANSEAASAFTNYYAFSDETISNASYMRLKNVSLAYDFPKPWVSHLKLQRGSIYFRAQNLFTITNYKGFDPENFGYSLPLFRTVTVGLNASF